MKRYESFPLQERCPGSNQTLPKVNNQSNFLKVHFGFSWFKFTAWLDTTLSELLLTLMVLTCEMMALNLSGSIISDHQNRCKSDSLPPGQTISVVVCQIGNCELTPAPGASGHPIAHSVSSTLGNYQLGFRFQTHVTID